MWLEHDAVNNVALLFREFLTYIIIQNFKTDNWEDNVSDSVDVDWLLSSPVPTCQSINTLLYIIVIWNSTKLINKHLIVENLQVMSDIEPDG